MGCKNSKDSSNSTGTNSMGTKAILERKLCLAKETPEPVFDLSECGLKDVPSGVFVLCKVLRKEQLLLNKNLLSSLKKGGALEDLTLIQVLDLSYNLFKVVPDLIFFENLKELYLSNNSIVKLPIAIKDLADLEILDISNNKLEDIEQICHMRNLRHLNISANANLKQLPNQLATCFNLTELIFDANNIIYPDTDILTLDITNILKYLAKEGNINLESIDGGEQAFSAIENEDGSVLVPESTQKSVIARKTAFEATMHFQDDAKQKFLQELLEEQNRTDTKLQELQHKQDVNRMHLIQTIIEHESMSQSKIDALLKLKIAPTISVLEDEHKEIENLFGKIQEENELRKNEIINKMSKILNEEADKIQLYQEQRENISHDVLEQENVMNLATKEFFKNYERNRTNVLEEISYNQELQKSAVAALLEKNDSQCWGLQEQAKIIEAQLASLTHYELSKRQMLQKDFLNDICEARMNLSATLIDLMEQQSLRRKKLLDDLQEIESQKDDDDFWLLKYQNLLDTNPEGWSAINTYLPTELGYKFLIYNVIHVLPFLMKVWRKKGHALHEITENDLEEAGIRNQGARERVILAISSYLEEQSVLKQSVEPCAPPTEEIPSNSATNVDENTTENCQQVLFCECVCCLDAEAEMVFLPCGHLCCCFACQQSLTACPMCRQTIEKKVKIIKA